MERYRITADSLVYYVTFTVIDWLPLFIREEPCKILTDSLNFCIMNKGLLVAAYVIMPTHMHAVVANTNTDSEQLKKTLDDYRKFTGRNLAGWCDRYGPLTFRRAIREEATLDRNRRIWQPSKHPEIIYSQCFLATKVDYLHQNPVRAGLVSSAEYWRYSSAAYYAGITDSDVVIAGLDW